MNKLLLGFLILIGIGANAQALKTNKYYSAAITTDNGTFYARFWVEHDGYIYQMVGQTTECKPYDTASTLNNGATTTYTWLNAGGMWSESQTFVFTQDIVSGRIYVKYLRVVQNQGEEPWIVAGSGYIYE